jgi:hypothetical protein
LTPRWDQVDLYLARLWVFSFPKNFSEIGFSIFLLGRRLPARFHFWSSLFTLDVGLDIVNVNEIAEGEVMPCTRQIFVRGPKTANY